MGILTISFDGSSELPLVKVFLFLEDAKRRYTSPEVENICRLLDQMFALSANFNWDCLEKFHFFWEQLVRCLWLSQGMQSLTLAKLYLHAEFNPKFDPTRVLVSIRTFKYDWISLSHQFPGRGRNKQGNINPVKAIVVQDERVSKETTYPYLYPDTILVPAAGNRGFDVGYVCQIADDSGTGQGFVCVETRWSKPSSKTKTSIDVIRAKWQKMKQDFDPDRFSDPAMLNLKLSEDRVWLVYVAFRDIDDEKQMRCEDIPKQVLVLDLAKSKSLYGPTLCQLRQFLQNQYKQVRIEDSDDEC